MRREAEWRDERSKLESQLTQTKAERDSTIIELNKRTMELEAQKEKHTIKLDTIQHTVGIVYICVWYIAHSTDTCMVHAV